MEAARDEGRFERTDPYLRPNQVQELLEDKNGIEKTMQAPPHIAAQIQDKGAMLRQLQNIERTLHEDMPQPYTPDKIDEAVKRERELSETIQQGMPTQAEMRHAPAGAVDKHRRHERVNKQNIREWKNIRLRLHASGAFDVPIDAQDISNVELLRPVYASHEVPLDNNIVPVKTMSMPSGPIPSRNHASPEDRERMLESRDAAAAAAQQGSPNLDME